MKMPFDGNFDKSKNYLIKGKDLIDWAAAYHADRVMPGRGIEVAGTPQGRIMSVVETEASYHAFEITSQNNAFYVQPGGFFCSATAYSAVIDNDALVAEQVDGVYNQVEMLQMIIPIEIQNLKADAYGLVFETDYLGNVQTAVLDWKPANGLQEFSPINIVGGKYFFPIVTFELAAGKFIISKIHRRSDITWQVNSFLNSGTTLGPPPA